MYILYQLTTVLEKGYRNILTYISRNLAFHRNLYRFYRNRQEREFDSESESEEDATTRTWTQTEIDRHLGVPEDWQAGDPEIFIYIDDANAVEKCRIQDSVAQISQNKQEIKVHAEKSQELLNTFSIRASQIGMRVNHNKTQ